MVTGEVKPHEALPLGLYMAKRLTKALREKRRWVGLVCASNLKTRNDIEQKLDQLVQQLGLSKTPRLMDFFHSETETSRRFCTDHDEHQENVGVMILRVVHEDTPVLRATLGEEAALERHGMTTYTTSGKIRLVRLRMGIEKPKRHKG